MLALYHIVENFQKVKILETYILSKAILEIKFQKLRIAILIIAILKYIHFIAILKYIIAI